MSTMNAATDTNATLAATRAKYAPSKLDFPHFESGESHWGAG